MTYRELVYMCLDEIKLASDDSYITEDHILFLISKYRAFLLRQKYDKTIPVSTSNYQLLKVENVEQPLPTNILINLGIPMVRVILQNYLPDKPGFTPLDLNPGNILPSEPIQIEKSATYVSPHRFEYVGNNRYINSFIYCTLNKNRAMEFKNYPINTVNPSNQLVVPLELSSYEIYAIFEDCVKASEFNLENGADILDCECPIEAELVSAVQELVVKDALGIAYRPKDIANNANDDLSSLGVASGNPKNNK